MEKKVASRLGAVAVGLGMAMAGGSGIAYATTDSDSSSTSASSQRPDNTSDTDSKSERETPKSEPDREPESSTDDLGAEESRDDDDSPRSPVRDTDQDSDEATPSRPGASRDEKSDETDADESADIDVSSDVDISDDVEDTPVDASAEVATPEPATVQGVNLDSGSDTSPAAPAGALAWMTSVAAWVQREVDYFVHGGAAPVTDPRQVVFDPSRGAMHGTLHAVGDQRDWLTYEVVDGPRFGTVTLSAEGGYVYTPGTYPSQGVTDSFTVAVRNHGFNLTTLMGLLNPALNTTLVAVDVDVPVTSTPPSVSAENEFHIYNFTSHTLRLTRGDRVNVLPSGPPVGDVIDPGEFHRVHLEFFSYSSGSPSYTLNYTSVDNPNVQYAVTLHQNYTTTVNDSWISCQAGCLPTGNFAGQTVALVDAPGTQMDVYADQAQKQGEVLSRLCVESNTLACTFNATSRETIPGDLELVDSIANSGVLPLVFSETFKTTLTNKSSVQTGVKASAKILNVLTVEVSQQYGDDITTTTEASAGYDLSIAPGTIESIYVQHGMIRYTGDFTMKAGNTTWVLHNVHFDTLDPDAPPSWTRNNDPIEDPIESGQVELTAASTSV